MYRAHSFRPQKLTEYLVKAHWGKNCAKEKSALTELAFLHLWEREKDRQQTNPKHTINHQVKFYM